MTTKINIIHPPNTFEKARRAELERLTGCPIHHVIDGTCREPGCQNAALQMQKEFVLSEDACLRLREAALDEGGSRNFGNVPQRFEGDLPRSVQEVLPTYAWDGTPSYARDAAPIFQTKPRMRCVL